MTMKYIESNFTSIECKFDMYLLEFSVSPNQYGTMCLHGPILHKILYEINRRGTEADEKE